MINVSTITTAVYDVINAANITGATIERGERINYDPGRCPWIGVYPGVARSSPLTIGTGNNRWQTTGNIQVVLQTASFIDDGQEASDLLESLALTVCSAVSSDLTLGVAGFRIIGAGREYKYVVFDSDGNGTVFMPQLIITFDFEQRSSGA